MKNTIHTRTRLYITARDVRRDRIGAFFPDTLGLKRVVDTTGWNFNALVLLVGDRVVYTLYGGQPNLREHEVSRQPPGPLPDFGESLPLGSLVRWPQEPGPRAATSLEGLEERVVAPRLEPVDASSP